MTLGSVLASRLCQPNANARRDEIAQVRRPCHWLVCRIVCWSTAVGSGECDGLGGLTPPQETREAKGEPGS